MKRKKETDLRTKSTRPKKQVDLNQLRERLVGVVEETMQPDQAWVWLVEGESLKEGQRGDLGS